MRNEIILIVKGQFVVLFIIILSYIIETLSNINLLFWGFNLKKNLKMANGAADLHAFLYFMICLLTLIFDRYIFKNTMNDFSFWYWFLLMMPLVISFRKIYFKFQKIDSERSNHDFSE